MKRSTLQTLAGLEEVHGEDARRSLARASEALERALERYQEVREAVRNHRRELVGPGTHTDTVTQPRSASAFLQDRASFLAQHREAARLSETLHARRRELRQARERVDDARDAFRGHTATRKVVTQRAEQATQRRRSITETQRADEADDRSADRYYRVSRPSGRTADSTEP